MTSKTYSNRGNTIRAARAALGTTAKEGKQFKIIKHDGNRFSWAAVEGSKRRAFTSEQKLMAVALQPKMKEVLDYIAASENGRTVSDLQRKLGGVESHTARGCVSRLRTAGFPINVGKVFRTVTYTIAKDQVQAARAKIEKALA